VSEGLPSVVCSHLYENQVDSIITEQKWPYFAKGKRAQIILFELREYNRVIYERNRIISNQILKWKGRKYRGTKKELF